jgi:hypothetical protein
VDNRASFCCRKSLIRQGENRRVAQGVNLPFLRLIHNRLAVVYCRRKRLCQGDLRAVFLSAFAGTKDAPCNAKIDVRKRVAPSCLLNNCPNCSTLVQTSEVANDVATRLAKAMSRLAVEQ